MIHGHGSLFGKKILLCGSYGFGNLGDDAILTALVQHLKAQGAEPQVLGEEPEAIASRWGVAAASWRPWSEVARAIAGSDGVIIGGGGLFQEYWGTDSETLFADHHDLTYYGGVALTAQLFRVPYALVGVGVGPVNSLLGVELVRATFAEAVYASVRDPGSRSLLERLGVPAPSVRVGADLAAAVLAKVTQENAPVPAAPAVVVNLRPWTFWPELGRFLPLLAQELAGVARRDQLELRLISFSQDRTPGHSDLSVLEELRQNLEASGAPQVTLVAPATLEEAWPLVASARWAVVMRYHAALLAALAGIPFLAIPYDPKVSSLLDQLQVSGSTLTPLASPTELRQALFEAAQGRLPRPSPGALETLAAKASDDLDQALQALAASGTAIGRLPWPATDAVTRLALRAESRKQLEQELALREAEREALARKSSLLHEEVQQLRQDLSNLRQRHSQLESAFEERQREVERLAHELSQRTEELDASRSAHAQLVAAYEERQREVERLSELLKSITSTRWFRLASWYWRQRDKLRPRGRRVSSAVPGEPTPRTPPGPTTSPLGPEPRLAPSPGKTKQVDVNQWFHDWVDNPNIDVLVLPIIEWGFRFQRPQQLARHLAQRGHRVYFASHRFGNTLQVKKLEPRVWEVDLAGPKRNVYREQLDEVSCDALFASVNELRRQHLLGATAVVVQLPFWWPLARKLREQFGWPVVYDCMDYHAGFSTNAPAMLQEEEELLRGADLVVVSSQFLEEQARRVARRTVLIPNACDFQHFAQVSAKEPGSPPVVGYYGAIADWFDSDLVADLAELRPDWQFLLVGSTFTADTSRLKRLANVRLVGEKPYHELPRWIGEMDVLIIPFKRTPLTEATNPVKFYEIMAAGKPLVSVPLPELKPYGELVRFAETAEAFAAEIEAALEARDPDVVEARRRFAAQHTWQERASRLAEAMAAAFPKASVIVVTHNNLALTRQCLDALFARTEWPNLEVFVVDNASSDGTQTYLRQLATTHANLHLILNPENRGFAAANNQALRQASGEFLVLLNNDTVVTRGWLSWLAAHLSANRSWGLVGPVTNWIGNEAQVEVSYQHLAEMPAWAAQWILAHYGNFFPIKVLAMYCLAMRRDAFEALGELDERFQLGMFEDDDYALRAREAGYDVICVEDVFVHHHGKAAFRQMPKDEYDRLFEANRRRFEEKWQRPWEPHRYRTT